MVSTSTLAKALVVHNDKILILRRSATDKRRPLQWDLPGGGVDPGEDIKQACAREILEEAGQIVAAADLKVIYSLTEMASDHISGNWIFMRALASSTGVTLSHEHCEARWVTVNEALGLFEYERQLRALRYVEAHNLLKATVND